jgi:hypothetical protein
MEQRRHINVALWPDQSTEKYNPRCQSCSSHQKLILQGLNWVCRECGTETPTVEVKHEKRLTAKFGSGPTGPMIISQGQKKKKSVDFGPNSELSEEDKAELRAGGALI